MNSIIVLIVTLILLYLTVDGFRRVHKTAQESKIKWLVPTSKAIGYFLVIGILWRLNFFISIGKEIFAYEQLRELAIRGIIGAFVGILVSIMTIITLNNEPLN